MANLSFDEARVLIEERFTLMEESIIDGVVPPVNEGFKSSTELIFNSATQAYRESLLGCLIARIQDRTIDIRLPYVIQGEHAFNGRTLDEKVINPFLHDKEIPCSRGPYLSVFRRQVKFNGATRPGLRDKTGYDAFLNLLSIIESTEDGRELVSFLDYILYSFVLLREDARIELTRLNRISLPQCDVIVSGLLATKSGGRIPLVLTASMFQTLNEVFQLDWEVEYQGINEADQASGVGGDITITRNNEAILSAEVTERPVDRNRVIATFRHKIASTGLGDYLFFVDIENIDDAAKCQANNYFSQGHDINFIDIKNWLLVTLATLGGVGRQVFMEKVIEMLSSNDVPKSLKVAWNEQMARITS